MGRNRLIMLSKFQKEVDSSNKRFRLVVGGRRIGKTWLARRILAKMASKPNQLIYAVYPTYRQGKQVLWPLLRDKMIRLKWAVKINETDLSIQLKNGSTIAIRGSDRSAALRGVKLGGAVFDEMATIDPEVWSTIILPALSDSKGKAVFLGTPDSMNHFYDMYNNAITDPEWDAWQITTAEGGFVEQEEIDMARSYMDHKSWEQEFFAKFSNQTGIVHELYNENIVPYEYKEPLTMIYLGTDQNIDPMSGVVAQVDHEAGTIHMIDEIEMYGSRTEDLAKEVRERYPTQKVVVFPDPAGSARKTNSNLTDHIVLRNNGFQVLAKHRHPSIRDRVNTVNSMIRSADGRNRLFIDPKCKRLIECLRKLTYSKGTMKPDKTSGYDHMVDAMSYMVDYLFAIEPLKVETQPKTWGIQTT